MFFDNLPTFYKLLFLNYQTTVLTVVSGMFGGIGRAILFVPLDISIFHSIEVCFFAALSAIMGYVVKNMLDYLLMRFKNRKRKTPKKEQSDE